MSLERTYGLDPRYRYLSIQIIIYVSNEKITLAHHA